jgi:hypothetical protein
MATSHPRIPPCTGASTPPPTRAPPQHLRQPLPVNLGLYLYLSDADSSLQGFGIPSRT